MGCEAELEFVGHHETRADYGDAMGALRGPRRLLQRAVEVEKQEEEEKEAAAEAWNHTQQCDVHLFASYDGSAEEEASHQLAAGPCPRGGIALPLGQKMTLMLHIRHRG